MILITTMYCTSLSTYLTLTVALPSHAIVIHNIQIYKLYQYTVSCTAEIQIQLIRSTHNHVSYTYLDYSPLFMYMY